MALMNRWEISNFLDSRKGREWIPDFVGECFDFGGLSSAVNMDNGLGKSSCTEAVLWMLSRDRELGRKTKPRIAPESDGRFTHIRCEFVEPKGDIAPHGERIIGETWVFGYYGNRGDEGCFYCYPGSLEDCPLHFDEIDDDGAAYKVCIPDEEFRASLAKFKNTVITGARDWGTRVRQFMSGAQLEQLVAYQKKGGGDKAATFYDVKVGRKEAFDEAFFRQFVAPEILVGVGDFDEDVDARGFDRKIVAQAQSVIDAKIKVKAKADVIARTEQNLTAIRAVNDAAKTVLEAERKFAEQAEATALAVTVIRSAVERWGIAGMPIAIEGMPLGEEDRQALIYGGWEVGGGPVVSVEWLDSHIGNHKAKPFKMIETGMVRVLPLSVQPIIKSRLATIRFARLQDVIEGLSESRSKSGVEAIIRRAEVFADAVRRFGITGLRRIHLDASSAFNRAQLTMQTLEVERTRLQDERAGLLDQLTKFEANEAAYIKMHGSGLFTDEELADPLTTQRLVEEARKVARKRVEDHNRRTVELEQVRKQYDAVAREFGFSEDLRSLLDSLIEAMQKASEESAEAQAKYVEAKQALEQLRRDEERAREALGVASRAMEEFARKAADMQTFQEEFGADADPAMEAERLAEARDTAQSAEALRETEAKAAAAKVGDLERQSAQVTDEGDRLLVRIGELEAQEPRLRAFEAAYPGRDATTFLVEETEHLRDGNALAKSAKERNIQFAPLVADLDGFETTHPGRDPSAWLTEAERTRSEATITLVEIGRQVAKATADRDALKAFRVAPTETDDAAAKLIADLPHRPLHGIIRETAGLPPSRRADLLDHFSALLFAPVFATIDAAELAARRLADAELPVPVLVEADLAAWISGSDKLVTRQVTTAGEVVTGLFTGIRTPTVEAILDPEVMARRLAETEAKLADLEQRQEDLREIVTNLSPEGEACRLARSAAEAITKSARDHLARAEADALKAADMIAVAEANLTAQVKFLVGEANRYLQAGGDAALVKAHEDAEAVEQKLVELAELLEGARDLLVQAESRLASAKEQARKAEARAAQWLSWCEKACAFIAGGGADELTRRRKTVDQADDAYRGIPIKIQAATIECGTLEDIKDKAVDASRTQEARVNRWREPLEITAKFVESGEREELARAPTTLKTLEDAEVKEEARLRFEFEAAANFVVSGGTKGVEPAKLRFEEIKARMDVIEREALPEATRIHDQAEMWSRTATDANTAAEQKLTAIIHAYHQVVTRSSFDGVRMVDGPENDRYRAVAAGLSDMAIAPEAPHDTDSMGRIVTAYETLADHVGTFSIDSLHENMKTASSNREMTRTQYEAAVDREANPNRPLDPAIRHKLESARKRPEEIPALLATVEQTLAWERTLHASAQEGLDKVQVELVSILQGIAGNASVNLMRLKKVLSGGEGAKIRLNVMVANDEQIGTVLERTVDDIEIEHTRFKEDQAKGRNVSEEQFSARLTSSVRETVYQRMFVNGGEGDHLITIEHPNMREGRPFRFERDGISGGQATALTLLWTIKLAEFAVVRETANLSSTTRRRANTAQHSIVIVDGLFSDLSKPELIDESMEAMQGIKGAFQLIGLIHSPHYRNNWERFPTLIIGRKVASTDDRGRKSEAVAIEGKRQVRGRVMALTYGASDGNAA
jgi:hypothetical protein